MELSHRLVKPHQLDVPFILLELENSFEFLCEKLYFAYYPVESCYNHHIHYQWLLSFAVRSGKQVDTEDFMTFLAYNFLSLFRKGLD